MNWCGREYYDLNKNTILHHQCPVAQLCQVLIMCDNDKRLSEVIPQPEKKFVNVL